MKSRVPYLSIIICGRNDNYGGDFTARLQNFITWNTSLLEKYKLDTEIIFVNWNPVVENPSIKDSIEWNENRKYVTYKILTIPNEIHHHYSNDIHRKTLPLYEYLAKNAGIRAAKGEFVLAMNPDILIHEKIIKEIAKKKLNKSAFYRANRIDFKNNDINLHTKIWLKGFSYETAKKSPLTMKWLQLKNSLRCFWRKKSINYRSFFDQRQWTVYYHNAEYIYHCNVSGDFMMMHKSAWQKLNGNPENTRLSLHTDALMVVMAGVSGLKEIVFSSPIYHQEHSRRFDATEKGNEENRTAYLYFQEEAQEMIMAQKPTIFNQNDWGLLNFDLPLTEF